MKIGVFDSGIGGLSVKKAIEERFPDYDIIFENDSQNVPYGNKSPDILYELAMPHLLKLVTVGCEIIVLACNTLSMNIIDRLRRELDVVLIGVEPMVSEAAKLTKTGVITVCATPSTLASTRYKKLTSLYCDDIKVIEPDCSRWSHMIENNKIDEKSIRHQINQSNDASADVIVLGCTHYHWIQELIQQSANNHVCILNPEKKILKQLTVELGRLS